MALWSKECVLGSVPDFTEEELMYEPNIHPGLLSARLSDCGEALERVLGLYPVRKVIHEAGGNGNVWVEGRLYYLPRILTAQAVHFHTDAEWPRERKSWRIRCVFGDVADTEYRRGTLPPTAMPPGVVTLHSTFKDSHRVGAMYDTGFRYLLTIDGPL